jgi:hypothetical protein
MKKLLKSMKRGSALPLAMIAVMILLAIGVAILSLGWNSRVYSMRTASDIAARCAADAGLTMALFEMNEKLQVKPWDGSTLPQATDVQLPHCDEICSYTVAGDLGAGYVITSTGKSDQARRAVRATIGLQGIFDHAILTKSTLVLKSGTTVDGYNSLDPLDADADVSIGTQSTLDSSIVLNMGVTVDGDVIVGAGGNPDTAIRDLGSTTTGDQYAGTSLDALPRITAPADLSNMGTGIGTQGQTVTITPADNGQYSNIDLRQSGSEGAVSPGVLVISGGDVVLHITGDIQLGQSCEIVIEEGSTLTLYVDGDMHCRESSGINTENPSQQAETLQVYGTGEGTQYFDIKAKSEFTGVIYAPNADVDLYSGGDVYGAIVADTFEFKAGGNYHYDEALREVDVDDKAVRFVVMRWDAVAAYP